MNSRICSHVFACMFAAAILLALAPRPVFAQDSKCDPKLKGLKSVIGYRDRGYACEGMYMGSQTAPLNVQVVSFVRGNLDLLDLVGTDATMEVRVEFDPTKYEPAVRIAGTGRRDNLNWAIHGIATLSRPMNWPKKEVVEPAGLNAKLVGLYGAATPKQSLGDDVVYIPVMLHHTHTKAAPDGDKLTLVLRVPAASRLKWQIPAESESITTVKPDPERPGFFTVAVPAASRGERETTLVIWWQGIGTRDKWSAPELLTIYR